MDTYRATAQRVTERNLNPDSLRVEIEDNIEDSDTVCMNGEQDF